MKVAIPRMGEVVAPCLEYSATIAIFTIEDARVVEQLDFPLRSQEPLDRVRLLRDLEVDTIICGGVQDVFGDLVRASGIELISWVSGNVDDLLGLFLQGRLAAAGSPETPGRQGREPGKRKRNRK